MDKKLNTNQLVGAVLTFLLTGCDIESFDQLVGGKKPFVVLGAGTEVRISDSETVTVFGSDLSLIVRKRAVLRYLETL